MPYEKDNDNDIMIVVHDGMGHATVLCVPLNLFLYKLWE